jgi:hypothetical protein
MKRHKQTEFEILQRVADEYRAMGYLVALHPDASELPAFLSGMSPDAIAHKENEHVVIEIKSSAELYRSDDLVAFANKMKSQPDWRIDLVAQPIRDDLRDQERYQRRFEVLPLAKIKRRLATARLLASRKDFEAALIIAWVALEATLRQLALRNEVELVSLGRPHLLKALVSQGIITRTDYQTLERSLDARNRVTHGHSIEANISRMVSSVMALTEHLVKDELLQDFSKRPV